MSKRKKILIVEDDAFTATQLQMLLEDAGYCIVQKCGRGAQAIEAALEHKPDLIFMDIMLKDNISGCDAAMQIKNLIDTKIIFISSYNDQEMIDYAIETKAANYIVKPLSDEQILTAVKLALKESRLYEYKTKLTLKNGFSFDLEKNILYKDDEEIDLNSKSLSLITTLCHNIDNVVDYQSLIANVYKKYTKDTALRTLVSRTNKIIGEPLIENVSRIGYIIKSNNE